MRRSTLIVVVVFVLLLAVALYLQKNPLPKGQVSPTPTQEEPLLSINSTQIAGIRMQSADGKLVELAKEGTNWQLKLPTAEAAESSTVDSALSSFATMTIRDKFTTPPSDEDMGLKNPTYAITVTMDTGLRQLLYIGKQTPIQGGYYVRLGNGIPVVINSFSISPLLGWFENPPRLPTPTPTLTETPGTVATNPQPTGTVTPTP